MADAEVTCHRRSGEKPPFLSMCLADGVDMAEQLVLQGWAWLTADTYLWAYRIARGEYLGIWAGDRAWD